LIFDFQYDNDYQQFNFRSRHTNPNRLNLFLQRYFLAWFTSGLFAELGNN